MDGGRYEAFDQGIGIGIGIGSGITPFLWVWKKKLLSAITSHRLLSREGHIKQGLI